MTTSEAETDGATAGARQMRTAWLVSTLGLAAAIGILTLTPVPALPRDSGQLDKLAHLVAFLALVLPSAALWPRALAPVIAFALAYGATIEVIQPYVGRSAEIADFLADALGIGLGTLIGTWLHRVVVSPRFVRAR